MRANESTRPRYVSLPQIWRAQDSGTLSLSGLKTPWCCPQGVTLQYITYWIAIVREKPESGHLGFFVESSKFPYTNAPSSILVWYYISYGIIYRILPIKSPLAKEEKDNLRKGDRRDRRFVDSTARCRSIVGSKCRSRAANRFPSCNSGHHSDFLPPTHKVAGLSVWPRALD